MSLTLEAEQKLDDVGLIDFYDKSKSTWLKLAKRAHTFVSQNFPEDATIRRDDVAKALLPVIQVNEKVKNHFSTGGLKQKYWFKDFVDLILDRTWDDISKKEKE